MTALILALLAGAVVGLALGSLGGGGSMLAVPALIYLLGFSPAVATTASLLIVSATSVTGLMAHARAGRVRWRSGLLFAAAGLPVAALFGLLSTKLPGALLTVAFALLAGFAAWRMLRPAKPAADGPAEAAGPGRAAAVGGALGGATGLLGVGGGFLAVPALVSVLAFSMAEAVGTSLLVITANSFAALVPRLGAVHGLDWAVIAPFTAAAVLGAWDGKRLADKLSGPTLQRVFGVVLLVVAALMLVSALVA
ncbi:sulfite exporter TauE/SafE family protein [Streptomyces beihaiensis]|uniref:Probable membrane transporter protein n=1 Tax=Streptomyces beihaiensis TaxID=2984495 RepID=A0ABT3TTD6_9ACTN|nr:sulfite exporter TauE/SafE family protein [Streptomyces beihaiensis]MCX3060045.1 sulfite exporter TauE/SafE family protein [Streptomyces beihaiensis]